MVLYCRDGFAFIPDRRESICDCLRCRERSTLFCHVPAVVQSPVAKGIHLSPGDIGVSEVERCILCVGIMYLKCHNAWYLWSSGQLSCRKAARICC